MTHSRAVSAAEILGQSSVTKRRHQFSRRPFRRLRSAGRLCSFPSCRTPGHGRDRRRQGRTAVALLERPLQSVPSSGLRPASLFDYAENTKVGMQTFFRQSAGRLGRRHIGYPNRQLSPRIGLSAWVILLQKQSIAYLIVPVGQSAYLMGLDARERRLKERWPGLDLVLKGSPRRRGRLGTVLGR